MSPNKSTLSLLAKYSHCKIYRANRDNKVLVIYILETIVWGPDKKKVKKKTIG